MDKYLVRLCSASVTVGELQVKSEFLELAISFYIDSATGKYRIFFLTGLMFVSLKMTQ
jgi:hypothetical protein